MRRMSEQKYTTAVKDVPCQNKLGYTTGRRGFYAAKCTENYRSSIPSESKKYTPVYRYKATDAVRGFAPHPVFRQGVPGVGGADITVA